MAENESNEKSSSTLSNLWESLKTQAAEVKDTVVSKAVEVKDTVMDKVEDYERDKAANEEFRKLGKKVYKLIKRGELTLPEECDKYLEKLN